MSEQDNPLDMRKQVDKEAGSIAFDDVNGGIHGSIFAGRDVNIYDGPKPVTVGALLDACQAQIGDVLFSVRHKYNRDLYVNRAMERELEVFFDTPFTGYSPNCYLIVAPAGSGKTNLLCDLARRRVHQQPVLVLLGGTTYVGSESGLLSSVQNELHSANPDIVFQNAADSLHTLDRLAQQLDRDALLFLDAINEYRHPDAMRQAIEDLLVKTRRRRIKLVITCRDYYWDLFKGSFWDGATVNELSTEDGEPDDGTGEDSLSHFTDNEYARALPLYLEHYDIHGRPVANAAEQCRHPLLLLFFCETYEGQEIGEVTDIRLKELFDRYWDRKLVSIAERMILQGAKGIQGDLAVATSDCLISLASYMLHNNVRAIPQEEIGQISECERHSDDRLSLYGRVRDEFIILEEKERGEGPFRTVQIAFVYEEFMEYVMARSLMRNWTRAKADESKILADIETLTDKYESFVQILGVMVYLSLMFKEQRGLALWPLLLKKGEHWQTVVFETFRKLPEEELDNRVFDALEEILTTGDEGLQTRALDTLKVARVGQAATAPIVNAVADLATNQKESVARRAALALGNMNADLAVPVLLKTMNSRKRGVRENSVKALGRLGDLRAVESVIGSLRSKSASTRQVVAEALSELKDRRAVEPLIPLLGDTSENVRQAVAFALGKLDDPRAVEPLVTALEDIDAGVRERAVEALGNLKDPRSVEPIALVLQNGDNKSREKAASALGKLQDVRSFKSLVLALRDAHVPVRCAAADALGNLGDGRCVQPLLSALRDPDERVQESVAGALIRLGQIAVQPLVNALGSQSPTVRQKAVAILGELGDFKAVESLVAVLEDDDREVRRSAIQALGRIWHIPDLVRLGSSSSILQAAAARQLGLLGDVRAIVPLISVLEYNDEDVRTNAAQALHMMKSEQAVEPLISALGTSGRRVRRTAARLLGELGDVRAVVPLISVLEDSNVPTRQSAAEALGKLRDARAVEHLIAAFRHDLPQMRKPLVDALVNLGTAAFSGTVNALAHTNEDVRRGVTEVLGGLGDERAVDHLAVVLNDSSAQVRVGAVEALGKLGPAAAAPLIHALTENEDPVVREQTAETLGRLRELRAVEPLHAALQDSNLRVRYSAVAALGRLGKAALRPLINALENQASVVRQRAAELLGNLGDAEAVEPLISALRDSDAAVRQSAAHALGRHEDLRAVEPLLDACNDCDPFVRQRVIEALEELSPQLRDAAMRPRILDSLVVQLRDEAMSVRRCAIRLLGKSESMRAVRPLIAALQDDPYEIQPAVIEALCELISQLETSYAKSAVELLIAARNHPDENIQAGAKAVLRDLGILDQLEEDFFERTLSEDQVVEPDDDWDLA